MKKKLLLRGLLGFPLGITIGYIITIVTSLIFAKGYYSPCVPDLVNQMGTEIGAVILQATLCGLLGFTFAASSIIWEIESWSMAKQTGIYFLITSLVMFPIAYVTSWMEHSLLGVISYFSVFILIFIIMWITQYFVWRIKIKTINKKIK